jgi:hypothetical protein
LSSITVGIIFRLILNINRTLCSGGVLTPSELRDRYPATRVHPPLKKWRSCTRGSRIKIRARDGGKFG